MLWNEELIQKYNLSGPRYTSYPTAPQFSSELNKITLIEKMLEPSNKSLSLYFHIPYCAHLCYYCACNKVVTKQYSKGDRYVEFLIEEMRLRSLMVNPDREVTQIHFGGGTPTFLSSNAFLTLFDKMHQLFNIRSHNVEISVEIDPREINLEKLTCLRQLGVNRLSLGIQDFDKEVQQAIHRQQSPELISEIMEQAKVLGFESINFDLIYGLPFQSVESFERTLDTVIQQSPDRLSVFSYAHLPHRFKAQTRILDETLPTTSTKLALLRRIIERLTKANYQYIGMDHFAKATDPLALAQNQRKLHRNFQGYTTQGDCDLIAFGASSISMLEDTYIQNHTDLNDYEKSIELGQLPISKGYICHKDDTIRRDIILALICHFEVDINAIEKKYSLSFLQYFHHEMIKLIELKADGLLDFDANNVRHIRVTESGRILIRCICMVFDQYLNKQIQYSKVI